jgi:hypothetical protein
MEGGAAGAAASSLPAMGSDVLLLFARSVAGAFAARSVAGAFAADLTLSLGQLSLVSLSLAFFDAGTFAAFASSFVERAVRVSAGVMAPDREAVTTGLLWRRFVVYNCVVCRGVHTAALLIFSALSA